MGSLRFADIQTRPTEVLELTSLTLKEFQHLALPFEAVFQAYMADWRLDGQPRTARRYTTYQIQHCGGNRAVLHRARVAMNAAQARVTAKLTGVGQALLALPCGVVCSAGGKAWRSEERRVGKEGRGGVEA